MSIDPNNYREALAATLARDSDAGLPPAFAEQRGAALEQFLANGFPHNKMENWRYTNLAPMAERTANNLGNSAQSPDAAIPPSDKGSIKLVFINGVFSASDSLLDEPPEACVIANISAASAKLDSDLLSVSDNNSSLAQLNLALLRDGALIQVPANTELAQPVHIVFSGTEGSNIFPRVLIELGNNAAATVIEHHVSNGASVSSAVTDIHCGDGAQLKYQKLQEEHAESFHVSVQNVFLGKDSNIDAVNIDLGAAIGRNDLRILFQGSGSHANVNGLFLVDGDRTTDNHLHLEHQSPHTSNRAHYAGVIADKGRGVFNGMINVHQAAQKTDAALYNKNVLLSKGAEINTKPELEIYADDVKCAHGSTTGQLDATSLFYLRTRGIPEQAARNMLVQAFAVEVVQQLATNGLREYVQQSVETRLNQLGVAVEV